jgi:uncharacterized protein (TIGR02996 family)
MGRSHFDPADGPRLMRGILENPADDQPRIAYSDWLEDRDEPGDRERAEFIRVQIELAKHQPNTYPRIGPKIKGDHLEFTVDHDTLRRGKLWELQIELFRRSFHLFQEHQYSWSGIAKRRIEWLSTIDTPRVVRDSVAFIFDRGFVSEIELDSERFLGTGNTEGLAKRLFDVQPIMKVVLTDAITRFVDADGIELNGKLPDELLRHLRYESTSNWPDGRRFLIYSSSQYAAKEALSDACVAFGRDLAELPPLEQMNGIESETGAYIANLVRQQGEVMYAVPLDDVYRRAGLDRPTSESSGESG